MQIRAYEHQIVAENIRARSLSTWSVSRGAPMETLAPELSCLQRFSPVEAGCNRNPDGRAARFYHPTIRAAGGCRARLWGYSEDCPGRERRIVSPPCNRRVHIAVARLDSQDFGYLALLQIEASCHFGAGCQTVRRVPVNAGTVGGAPAQTPEHCRAGGFDIPKPDGPAFGLIRGQQLWASPSRQRSP